MVSLSQIDALQPDEGSDVATALAFLHLVVQNNPNKSASELTKRLDVQSAMAVVDTWLKEVTQLAEALVEQAAVIPAVSVVAVREETRKTSSGLKSDTRITDSNLAKWLLPNWVAKIILRMKWFLNFLAGLLGIPGKAGTKTWISRLAANTCTYCRRLHGTTIPLGESFSDAARKAGFLKVYGGLFAPPLHPNCRCRLEFDSSRLADTA